MPISLPAEEANDEIAALIATLHKTSQRLEVLTAGEVDTVADAEGRPFLLRQPQEHLRGIEAARREASATELRVSESRFRQIAEAIRDVFYLIDAGTGQILFVSSAYEAIWGRSVASVLGQSWIEVVHPDDRDAVFEENKAGKVEHEYRILRPDGSIRWIESRSFPVRDDAGKVTRLAGVARDITDSRRDAKALRESERRFSDLLKDVELLSVMLDREARITYCNEYLLRLAGWRMEEVVGRNWFEVFVPAEAGDMKAVFDSMLAGLPEARNRDNRIVTRSGEQRLIRWNNSVLRSGDGDVIGTASIGEDVTDRERDQSSLRQNEERTRLILESALDAVVAMDAGGRITEWNAQAEKTFGWARQDVIGKSLAEAIVPARYRDAHTAGLRKFLDTGKGPILGKRIEISAMHRDGREFPIELTVSPLRLGEKWIFNSFIRDLTEQKRGEAELRRFRAAMDVSGDAILLIDRASMRYIDVNQTLCDMTGLTREELIGKTAMEVFNVDRETLEHDYDALIADNKSSANLAVGEYRHKDGSVTPVESRRGALQTQDGWTIVGSARDITARNAAEARIVYLNRVYSVLSGINTLIVRVGDRDELFREACRIAVEAGGFRTAWIGMVDAGEKKIVLAASAGASADLLGILRTRFSMGGSAPLGDSLTARAIREKKVLVSNDSHNDPGVWISHHNAYAGLRSMAILPLIVGDEAVGALTLYAGEADFFHAEEMKLLTELAGDVAFAIDHLAKQERINYLAYFDAVTGLANRTLFLERLGQYIRGTSGGTRRFALFFIDLERFKNINESLGRPAGDDLLRQVAVFLTTGENDPNLMARVGSDHFAVVMPEAKNDGEVTRFLEDRIERFREHPFRLNDAVFRIAMKVGVAIFPDDGADAETLLRNAEAALKKAKQGGDRYLFYKQKMTDRGAGKLSLENKLRTALKKDEYVLHYQPKVSLLTGKLTSAEALIRWNDPQTGLVPPGQFIPILEETGLIHDVGRWALHNALQDYLRWRAAGLPAVRIAVNVSPLQLRDRGFIAEVAQAIGVDAFAPDGLELEITESLIMADVKHSIASLQAIRDMKVTVAIDDFGTGFSSLAYLAKLPVDTLKIDRSFIIDLTTGPDGLSLVSTIINLAHALKLKVVAEGVETEEQSRLLRLLDCNEMQGYLFSKPVPAADFEARFLAPATLPEQAA